MTTQQQREQATETVDDLVLSGKITAEEGQARGSQTAAVTSLAKHRQAGDKLTANNVDPQPIAQDLAKQFQAETKSGRTNPMRELCLSTGPNGEGLEKDQQEVPAHHQGPEMGNE